MVTIPTKYPPCMGMKVAVATAIAPNTRMALHDVMRISAVGQENAGEIRSDDGTSAMVPVVRDVTIVAIDCSLSLSLRSI